MNFNEHELGLIETARLRSRQAVIIRVCILLLLIVAIAFMFADYIGQQAFSYLAMVLAVIAVMQPIYMKGPKYEDLVAMLISKVDQQD